MFDGLSMHIKKVINVQSPCGQNPPTPPPSPPRVGLNWVNYGGGPTTAPAIRAAVKTVVSCQCSRLRFRMLRLKTEETPVFYVCKQKQEFIATEAI